MLDLTTRLTKVKGVIHMSSVGEISANQTNAMKKCWVHEKHEHYLHATLFLTQPNKIIYGDFSPPI